MKRLLGIIKRMFSPSCDCCGISELDEPLSNDQDLRLCKPCIEYLTHTYLDM